MGTSGRVLLLSLLGLSGCGAHWGHPPEPPPAAVRELQVRVPADAPMPIVLQYWHRNALLVDLQGVTSQGEIQLLPRDGGGWPVKLEFRVAPGRFEVLELKGDQRVLYPVAAGGAAGAKPVIVSVDPGVYSAQTAQISVRWGGR